MTNLLTFLFWLISFVFVCLAEKDVVKPPGVILPEKEGIHRNVSYCFRFTWIGPRFDSESNIKNVSCNHILKDGKGIPCRRPLVVTDNSNLPDTKWMWDNYRKSPNEIACKMTNGDVCVKYLYIYNNAVENVTYMCSKVRIVDEAAVTNGCFTQYRNGRKVEVCVCKSNSGQMPCNKGNIFHLSSLTIVISVLFALSMLIISKNS